MPRNKEAPFTYQNMLLYVCAYLCVNKLFSIKNKLRKISWIMLIKRIIKCFEHRLFYKFTYCGCNLTLLYLHLTICVVDLWSISVRAFSFLEFNRDCFWILKKNCPIQNQAIVVKSLVTGRSLVRYPTILGVLEQIHLIVSAPWVL